MTLLHQAAQKAVEAALRRAFHLGQIYWQQADSESRAQNRQAETTQSKFDALAAETLSALQQQPEPVAVWQSKCKDGTWVDCDEANAQAGESYGFPCRVLYTAPPALQERRRTEYTPGGLAVTVVDDAPALQQQEVPREPPESELVCYEAYAALGMFLMELAEGGHPQAEKLLDNLSQARLAHKDVLPFSPSTTQQQEAGSGWIGVNERLPELGTECLVYGPHWFSETPCIRMDCWDEQREALVSFSSLSTPVGAGWCDSAFEEVTHWMPLPAAPSTPDSAEKDDAGGGKEGER